VIAAKARGEIGGEGMAGAHRLKATAVQIRTVNMTVNAFLDSSPHCRPSLDFRTIAAIPERDKQLWEGGSHHKVAPTRATGRERDKATLGVED
jgi:hypothetical protein